MIRSMTGFASKTFLLTLPDGSSSNVIIHLKSLNSRYFETSFRLPYPLNSFEIECIKLFKSKLFRGHIYCTIHLSNASVFKGGIEPVIPLVKQYVDAVATIKKECTVTGELTIETLFTIPSLFAVEEQPLEEQSKKQIYANLNDTIVELIAVQEKEGEKLKTDLLNRVTVMDQAIQEIALASEKLVEKQKQKIHTTLAELTDDESKFAEIRKNALYALLDKIDIHEEVIRFKSHLEALVDQFKAEKIEKGKRLDFTLQELMREINTVTAKCSDAQISFLAINIKVELEKAREQAQNIV